MSEQQASLGEETRAEITASTQPEEKGQPAESLKDVMEKAGQISESEMEEGNLVDEFFASLLKILKPFSQSLEISAESLPDSVLIHRRDRISKSYVYLSGLLVLVSKEGEVQVINLKEKDNREILVEITGEIMEKLKSIIDIYKFQTEKRVNFLLPITRELQKVARVFSERQP